MLLLLITRKLEGTTLRCTALSRHPHQFSLKSTKLLKIWNETRQAMYELKLNCKIIGTKHDIK